MNEEHESHQPRSPAVRRHAREAEGLRDTGLRYDRPGERYEAPLAAACPCPPGLRGGYYPPGLPQGGRCDTLPDLPQVVGLRCRYMRHARRAIRYTAALLPVSTTPVGRGGRPIPAILAVVAVVLELVAAFFTSWPFEREKAERCRVLKLLFPISHELWSGATREARQDLFARQGRVSRDFGYECPGKLGEGRRRDPGRRLRPQLRRVSVRRYSRGPSTTIETSDCAVKSILRSPDQTPPFLWGRFTRPASVLCFFPSIMAVLEHFGVDEVLRARKALPGKGGVIRDDQPHSGLRCS